MGQFAGIALIWFIIEMLIWYLIAQYTSGWYVFFWFIVAGIIGLVLILKGMATLNPMAQQVKSGNMMNPAMQANEDSMMKTVAGAFAGVLLLIPGVLSDVLALLVLLPPVQKKIKEKAKNYAMNNQDKMMQMMAKQMGGQSPFGGMGGMGNMGGQSPFGNAGQNPFGSNNPFGGAGGQNPFGSASPFGKQHTTIDGTAKTIKKDAKKLNSANDD